jgi:opacity protein-like surface antigen
MNYYHKAGIAIAAAAFSAISMIPAASAGGLYEPLRGSMKDAPQYGAPSVGPCYLRGDVGYSVAGSTTMHVESPNYPAVGVNDEDLGGAWMGEIGIGCGSGSKGFRGDLTLGYRGDRDVDGYKTDRPGVHFPADLSSKVSTLTAMANVYYDFGKVQGFVPYVGAGIGIAHHSLGDVTFDFAGFPATNRFETIGGSSATNFAWSLMAGVAYQISNRAVLDLGYRYIDMGSVSTRGNICDTCVGGGSNDRFTVEDINAHEFKIGLRYHFGGHSAPSYK